MDNELYNLSDKKVNRLAEGHATGDCIKIHLQTLEKIQVSPNNADTQLIDK